MEIDFYYRGKLVFNPLEVYFLRGHPYVAFSGFHFILNLGKEV